MQLNDQRFDRMNRINRMKKPASLGKQEFTIWWWMLQSAIHPVHPVHPVKIQ
jgi:hypothetical protein